MYGICFVCREVKSAKSVTKVAGLSAQGFHFHQCQSQEWQRGGHSCHACNSGMWSFATSRGANIENGKYESKESSLYHPPRESVIGIYCK